MAWSIIYQGSIINSAPSWFVNQTDSTWLAIAGGAGFGASYQNGNRLTDVVQTPLITNTGGGGRQESICDAWTGGCVDQTRKEYIFAANGGHADGASNACYALTLIDGMPSWRRIVDSTPQANIIYSDTTDSTFGAINTDGRPRACHNSNLVFAAGHVWQVQQNFFSSPGGGVTFASWSLNRDSLGAATTPLAWANNLGPWVFHELVPITLSSSSTKSSIAVYDRIGKRLINLSGSSENNAGYWITNVDPVSETFSLSTFFAPGTNTVGSWDTWAVCAHDLGLVITGDSGSLKPRIIVMDLSKIGQSDVFTVITNVTGTPINGAQGDGAIYCPANHTILCGNPEYTGGQLFKLQIPMSGSSYNPNGQWVWTNTTPSGGPASGSVRKAYSKWNIVEDMGNGQSALIICAAISEPTYVYKIPIAGP